MIHLQMIKVVELLIESWPKMDLGDVRNGWPAKITLAYDDGADGLEIVQSGREPAGVVRNANEEWSLDGWMDRGRGGDCQMQELYHLPSSPFPYSPTLSLICLSLACFIGRQQQLLPDQGLLLGRSIVSLTRGQYNSPLSLLSLCSFTPFPPVHYVDARLFSSTHTSINFPRAVGSRESEEPRRNNRTSRNDTRSRRTYTSGY